MKRPGATTFALWGVLGFACTPAERTGQKTEAGDAATTSAVLQASGYGVRVDLEPGWMVLTNLRREPTDVRILSEARRPIRDRAVLPKLVFTAEPSPHRPPAEVFRDTLTTLRALDERPGVRVIRTGLMTRTLPEGLVGEIDLVYRLESEDKTTTIVHRSLAMTRPEPPRGLALVTLTATYLQADAPRIGPEVDRIFTSFRVASPR